MFCTARSLLVGTVLLLSVSPVLGQAQPQPPRPTFTLRLGSRILYMILRTEEVQKELKITEDQLAKLTIVQQDYQQKLRETVRRGGQPVPAKIADIRAKLDKLQEQLAKKTKAILTKAQSDRGEQIALQQAMRSPSLVLLNPPYDKKLAITAEQKKKIEALREERIQAMRNMPRNFPPEQRRDAYEKISKQTLKKIKVGVLTLEQRKKLKELLGKPFDFPPRNTASGR